MTVRPVSAEVEIHADSTWRALPTFAGREWLSLLSPIDLEIGVGSAPDLIVSAGTWLPSFCAPSGIAWYYRNAAGAGTGTALLVGAERPIPHILQSSNALSTTQLEWVDIANGTLTDTNNLVDSASTDVDNVTTITLANNVAGQRDRIDNGGAYWTFDLHDRQGNNFQCDTYTGAVWAGIIEDTAPALDSNTALTIGTRVRNTTAWATAGMAWRNGGRYATTHKNATTGNTVAITGLSAVLGSVECPPNCYYGIRAYTYTASGNYDRTDTQQVASEANLSTVHDLVVECGYSANPVTAGPHTIAAKIGWQRPWAWLATAGLVSP